MTDFKAEARALATYPLTMHGPRHDEIIAAKLREVDARARAERDAEIEALRAALAKKTHNALVLAKLVGEGNAEREELREARDAARVDSEKAGYRRGIEDSRAALAEMKRVADKCILDAYRAGVEAAAAWFDQDHNDAPYMAEMRAALLPSELPSPSPSPGAQYPGMVGRCDHPECKGYPAWTELKFMGRAGGNMRLCPVCLKDTKT